MPKVFLIMLDGVGADTFRTYRSRLPFLSHLAAGGYGVERLRSLVPGISLPGRTSILTGRSAADAGVYGNNVWHDTLFSYADPDDVRVPTLPRLALAAGLDVACIGFGMVRPEDATVFKRPWWADDFVQRARDDVGEPAQRAWRRAADHVDPTGRLIAAAADAGYPTDYPERFPDRRIYGLAGDMRVANWAGLLAAADPAPDLMLTELLMTDSVQHSHGFDTEAALWALGYLDALVGVLLNRLGRRAAEYNFVVLSDHGHWHVQKSLRPAAILPGMQSDCEGALLHVKVDSAADEERATAALAEFGVVPYDASYLPEDHRVFLRSYLAPDGYSFEAGPSEQPVTDPKNISSHGLRPGHPADDRFMFMSGPDVPTGSVAVADADQVAPTVAKLLGIGTEPFPGRSLLG